MIVVFCAPEDTDALWLASEISRRDVQIDIALPDELVCGSDFRLDIVGGRAIPFARLASGRIFNHEVVTAVVNRMTGFPIPDLKQATDKDLIYANEEVRAALVAWFWAWDCPVIGRPHPYCAYGDSTSDLRWRIWAARSGIPSIDTVCGLETDAVNDTEYVDILYVGGSTFSSTREPVDPRIQAACTALSHLHHDPLFVARFGQKNGRPAFSGMQALPPFHIFDANFVDVLIKEVGAR